jgi:hypothetical protein
MSDLSFKDAAQRINKIEITDATLSNRGGLVFILRYLENIQLFPLLESVLTGIRKSAKGKPVSFVIRQILAYFIDGSMKAISSFDDLREDEGYAATLEVEKVNLLSSHAVKRFFSKFSLPKSFLLRHILNTLFIWRLRIKKPSVIELDMDTMVLDNNDALQREGVSPAYKKKKGFQPLQITWNDIVVDAMFRRGSAHSNHGNDVQDSVKRLTELIRRKYDKDAHILVACDSGFLDEKNFEYFNNVLKIFFIGYGKLYDTVKDFVLASPNEQFKRYDNGRQLWDFIEFGSKLQSWKKIGFLRTIFTRLLCDENNQMILDIARPDSVLYTNIGSNAALTKTLVDAGHGEYLEAKRIIEIAHGRGRSELTNRSLKDFMTCEQLPFKRFGMNAAYYYLMLIGHALFQFYKEDILDGITPISAASYPTTVRRTIIDFAAKIAYSGNYVRLQLTRYIHERFNIPKLWERCTGTWLVPIPLLR